jgi:hypothetical protein
MTKTNFKGLEMATKDEQETTVTYITADSLVQVYTAVPKHLRRLRSDKRATEISGGDDWGIFYIESRFFDPLNGFKRARKEMTPEQKAASAKRLADARANRK